MPVPTEVAPAQTGPSMPPRLWVAAAAEIGVAIAVSALVFRGGRSGPAMDHSEPAMAGMHSHSHSHHEAVITWHTGTLILAALTALALTWWLLTRARVPAALAAVGLVALGASGSVRALALQSHLAAMAALEVIFVAVPLLCIAALPHPAPTTNSSRSRAWAAGVVLAVALNSALLIGLHLPAIHNRGAHLDAVPLWLVPLVVAVGLGYWSAILATAGRVSPDLRRGALVVGQEVGAILGLATLVGSTTTHHMRNAAAWGLPTALDQRLGGVLMLATCAAVTLPLIKRIDAEKLRMEKDVN